MTTPDLPLPAIFNTDPGQIAARRARFAQRVREGRALVMPGVADPLAGRLVEQAGFECCYVTGAGIANVQFGIPDIGLLGLDEVTTVVRRVSDAVTLPVMVDADTGYGGTLSVMRTVRLLEAAGAAAIQLEDQAMPKRCGHFDRHSLVTAEEMVGKLRAATAVRADTNLLIVGRTDALGVLGEDEAIRRAHLYREAGADVIFVEAPQSIQQLERIGKELAGVPLVANVVEGGRTPQLSAAELEQLGFTIVLFANALMRIMVRAGQRALRSLHDIGDTRPLAESMLTWSERQNLVDLDRFSALERRFEETSLPQPSDGKVAS